MVTSSVAVQIEAPFVAVTVNTNVAEEPELIVTLVFKAFGSLIVASPPDFTDQR